MQLPSLNDLNQLNDAGKVQLLLLRCFCTSDLSSHYGCYGRPALRDIVRQSKSYLKLGLDDGVDLSDDDRKEMQGYIDEIDQFASSI